MLVWMRSSGNSAFCGNLAKICKEKCCLSAEMVINKEIFAEPTEDRMGRQ